MGALALADRLDRLVRWIGERAAWLMVVLMAVTIFDVVTRRFFVLGSTLLQELEWHVHTMNFCLALGFAYLADAHVRIDLVRERLSPRARAWIETLGCLFFFVPFCVVILVVSLYFVEISWAQGERSSSGLGLPFRWAIKAFIPISMILLLAATVAILLKNLLFLFGPAEVRERLSDLHRAHPPVGT
jgi:TRAP-type mannitol/chloroaromatic compound transport system permease small subunit